MKKIIVTEYLKFQAAASKAKFYDYENAYRSGYWNVFLYSEKLEEFLLDNKIGHVITFNELWKTQFYTGAAFLDVYAPAVVAILLQQKREFSVKHNDRFTEFTVFGVQANIEAFEHLNGLVAYSLNYK